MKKIICPTDFSAAANNAVEYAAKFAQHHHAALEIIHVQQISAMEPVLSGQNVIRNFTDTNELLDQMCRKVSSSFNISCSYSVEVTTRDLEKITAGKSEESNVMVIGTNGADEVFQYFFGTNSYHVSRKSTCPVVIVPEGTAFRIPRKIVFAWDYDRSCREAVLQLNAFAGSDDTEIILLHISRKKTPVSDEVFNALKNEMLSSAAEHTKIRFKQIYSAHTDDFPARVDEFFKDAEADMLAVTHYKRAFPTGIFHGTILRELSEVATYPLLVLHA